MSTVLYRPGKVFLSHRFSGEYVSFPPVTGKVFLSHRFSGEYVSFPQVTGKVFLSHR